MGQHNITATIVDRLIDQPRLKLSYPEVQGLPNKLVEYQINQSIKLFFNKLLDHKGYHESQNHFSGGYTVTVNKNNVLSIKFNLIKDFQGSAHPINYQKSITVNLATSYIYKLEDLFLPNMYYSVRIDSFILKEILDKQIPLVKSFKGIGPNHDFYLTDSAFIIYFQIYKYTPYFFGIPEFHIPYLNLDDLINQNGPIGLLLSQ